MEVEEATADAITKTEKAEVSEVRAEPVKEEQPERRGRGRPPGRGKGTRGRPPKTGRAKASGSTKRQDISEKEDKQEKSQPVEQVTEAPQIEIPQFSCAGCKSSFSVVGSLYSHYPFCSSFRRKKGLPTVCVLPEQARSQQLEKSVTQPSTVGSLREPEEEKGGNAGRNEVIREAERRSTEWLEVLGQLIMSLGDVSPPSELEVPESLSEVQNMEIEEPSGNELQRSEADEGRPVQDTTGEKGNGERIRAEQGVGDERMQESVHNEEGKTEGEDGGQKEVEGWYSELSSSAVLALVNELNISDSDTFLNIGSGMQSPISFLSCQIPLRILPATVLTLCPTFLQISGIGTVSLQVGYLTLAEIFGVEASNTLYSISCDLRDIFCSKYAHLLAPAPLANGLEQEMKEEERIEPEGEQKGENREDIPLRPAPIFNFICVSFFGRGTKGKVFLQGNSFPPRKQFSSKEKEGMKSR
jgi:hypothetical protein